MPVINVIITSHSHFLSLSSSSLPLCWQAAQRADKVGTVAGASGEGGRWGEASRLRLMVPATTLSAPLPQGRTSFGTTLLTTHAPVMIGRIPPRAPPGSISGDMLRGGTAQHRFA